MSYRREEVKEDKRDFKNSDQKRFNVVEYMKKSYTDWSNSTDTKSSSHLYHHATQLKTLPQAQGQEMNKVIAQWKATLPDISPKDVRRFYIQYYEAILLELQEEGYNEAYYNMMDFLEMDDRISEQTPGMMTWKKPYLRYEKDFINCLKNGFVAAEKSRRKGDSIAEAMALLDIALFFQSKTWEWWWISDRIYQSALKSADVIEKDKGQTITLIRYLYGRFLFNELQKPKEALDYLTKAREVSAMKIWNASKKLGIKQGSIFKESNILLYKILLILARKDRLENPSLALKEALEALERAQDADYPEYINESYYELGKCYIAVNDVKSALQTFSRLLALARRIGDIEGVCNAHMELAFTYKGNIILNPILLIQTVQQCRDYHVILDAMFTMIKIFALNLMLQHLNDNDNTERHLRLCRENAEHLALVEKLAHAHYYTGEHFLSRGKLHMSTNHLETAFSLYKRLDLSGDSDRARCVAGVSKGQENIEKYIDTLLRCGEYDQSATLKLCRWKSNREAFWTEDTYDSKSDHEALYESSGTISSLQSAVNDEGRATLHP